MTRHIATLSLVLLLAGNTQAQVVGGTAKLSGIDFFCSLTDPLAPVGALQHGCGASLIAPEWVLTAGHCVTNPWSGQPDDSIDVVVAPYIVANGAQYLRVRSEAIYIHEDFNMQGGTLAHDIALIKLRTPMTSVTPVMLPAQGDYTYYQHGTPAYVAGYGISDSTNFTSPDTLYWADIDMISNDTCNLPKHYGGQIAPGMVCAGKLTGHNKGGAAGDSGGPLFVSNTTGITQIGVVSWGQNSFSTTTHPGVYTRVATYRKWIDSVMGVPSAVRALAAKSTTLTRKGDELYLTLGAAAERDLVYAIYSYDGREVAQGTWRKGNHVYTADISSLQDALYIIRVADGSEYHYAGKLPLVR